MTIKERINYLGSLGPARARHVAMDILLQLCERLPASTLADMVAHTIATDEEGESESTSDFLYDVGKIRFGDDWQFHVEAAKARYDTAYIPG